MRAKGSKRVWLLVGLVTSGLVMAAMNAWGTDYHRIYFDQYSYDYLTNEISFNNHIVKDFYEIYFSANKKNVIYTKINKGDEPEVFVIKDNAVQQITDDVFLEFNAVINDNGDYAYAMSEYSVSLSKVYLNNVLLTQTNDTSLYKHLEINNKYLVFARERTASYDYTQYLCIYDLTSHLYCKVQVDGFINYLKFINDNELLIQIYRPATLSSDIYYYNISTRTLKPVCTSPDDEIIRKVTGNYYVIDVIRGSKNAKYLFNAYYSFYRCQLANPFANSNNFMGRLSYNEAYRLEFLIKLFEFTGDSNIKSQINQAVENLLSVNNLHLGVSGTYTADYLWASRKYSFDYTTPISENIEEARIFYPLLLAANKNLLDNPEAKALVLQNAALMMDYFEKDYNVQERVYHMPKGMPLWYDGLWVPYNFQSCLGLCALELYKATNDEKYRLRAFELAQRFKSEWVYTADNRILWHYWPQEYYNGWTAADNISVNTPTQAPSQDNVFEDTWHAGYNLKYIIRFNEQFPGQVFSDNDFILLRNTVDGFIKGGNNFSRFMSGNPYPGIGDDFRWIPPYFWVLLGYSRLNDYYINLIPKFYPEFEQENRSLTYVQAINNVSDGDSLTVESVRYDVATGAQCRYTKTYNFNEIQHYFIDNPSKAINALVSVLLVE